MALQPLLLIAGIYLPGSSVAVVAAVPIALAVRIIVRKWPVINPTAVGLFLSVATYWLAYLTATPGEHGQDLFARLAIATVISALYATGKVRDLVKRTLAWLKATVAIVVVRQGPGSSPAGITADVRMAKQRR